MHRLKITRSLLSRPASMFDSSSRDPNTFIGREFGSFTILKLIGKGAAGLVFSGFQKNLRRQVAIKVMLKTDQVNEAARRLFHQEAQIIAGLNHPNIIPIFDMGEAEDCYYQVIQIITGPDLDHVIKNRLKNPLPQRRLLPINEIFRISKQILEGLGYAHEEGLVHQDIKPANILMEEKTQRPLIVDFGIAKTRFSEVKQEGVIVGSPMYIAPEQIENVKTDHRADVFSVGVMLFQMLAGRLPLAVKDPITLLARKLQDPLSIYKTRPVEASPLIDKELEMILVSSMMLNPDKRFQNCYEFRDALIAYQQSH
ncbi:MAG: protein kinase [Chitinivibrionales bacterium]|nr:protein kinase [Chitinivibrionales bacterium]